jgi:thiazole/oxazole-forming peptide maturase SagC family component
VFLVGLGAVGSRVASSLALNGLGRLFVTDSKKVGPADIELGPYTNRDAGTQRGEALRSIVPDKTELNWIKANLSDRQFLDCLNLVDLVICCSENRSSLYRSSLNRMCVAQGKPWLNTAVYENHGEVGPTVIPYMSPCFDCYFLRIKSNIDDTELFTLYQEQLMSDEAQLGLISPFADIIGGLTTLEALKYLGKYAAPATLSGVLHVNFKTYNLSVDRLLKVPNCPTCGKKKGS